MEIEETNLITINLHHLIMSNKTKRPYIDDDRTVHGFECKSDANEYIKENNLTDVNVSESKTYEKILLCTDLYLSGADKISVKPRNGKAKSVSIGFADVNKKEYYNLDTNFNVTSLKHSSKKKYLRALRDCMFIAPVKIDKREKKNYPVLHYSYATTGDETKYFCLFTTLKEFNAWNNSQPEKWQPIEASVVVFNQIRNNNPIIINALSDKMVLTNADIKEMNSDKKAKVSIGENK